MAFFDNETKELKSHIIDDLVGRAVGLIAWQEVDEVLPYYCEGLIHLSILFNSGVISYDKQLKINYTKYDAMKREYKQAYKALAKHYINKEDANIYLTQYAKKENGTYLPVDSTVRAFVKHYYNRYKLIGQQVYQEEVLSKAS